MKNISSSKEKRRIYIGELGRIINRDRNTIRIWQRYGPLPKRLFPETDHKNWRYWSYNQVYGKQGIIAWMKKEDMRPGIEFTHPDDEATHVQNLRKPRLLTKKQLKDIDQMVREGYARSEIIAAMHPRTKYNRPEGFEIAITKYYKERDMYFPPKIKIKRQELPPSVLKELERLEKKIGAIPKG